MNKKRLLIWADSPTVKTGFGVVSNNLFSELHKIYDVAILGINYFGFQRYDSAKYFIYPVEGNDPMGVQRFSYILNDFKPDCVLLFQDIFNIDIVLPMIKRYSEKIPIISYFPIDGCPVSKAWYHALTVSTKLITYTNWAIEELRKAFPELQAKNISYLYHGVDTATFYPQPMNVIKKFKEERGWSNKFLCISVNRFQPRKMLTLVLRAHALFSKGYKVCKCGNVYLSALQRCDLNYCSADNVVKAVDGRSDAMLYVHASVQEPIMGLGKANLLQNHLLNVGFVPEDLNKLISVYGQDVYKNPLTDFVLAELYNCADVNVSTSLGEGAGLSLLESAATATTSIAPLNSAIPEMLGDTGHIIPNSTLINMAQDNGHLRPVVSLLPYLQALEIEYQKWLSNDKRKVKNMDAVKRVNELFLWPDKRTKLQGWLQEYV